ncbi:DUF5053 domain-containing protein [Dysgonomonas sp. GY75]|uniref:DUF5053 domain-containing protein n=1 Tax=Dysgonomonas sp. GY75 TaxID=2780419 RepID=UPI0018838658|nr:DUF5053 domain-containing protein [Dysgonomonas sp. GY75]MBF0649180.1 DUF5053 domain-containing protein [Dysgonomonas sp. GY75]
METCIKKASVKQQLSDVLLDISWAKISQKYFGKSSSWMYHKLDGIDGNGKPIEFTHEEKEQLRGGLLDMSERIRRAAESIK